MSKLDTESCTEARFLTVCLSMHLIKVRLKKKSISLSNKEVQTETYETVASFQLFSEQFWLLNIWTLDWHFYKSCISGLCYTLFWCIQFLQNFFFNFIYKNPQTLPFILTWISIHALSCKWDMWCVQCTVSSEDRKFDFRLGPFCVEFACSPCAWMGFVRVLWFSPASSTICTYTLLSLPFRACQGRIKCKEPT